MNQKRLLAYLEELARLQSLELIYDTLTTRGGLCRYRDKRFLVVNRWLPPSEKVAVVAQELARLGVDSEDLHPDVRAALSRFRPLSGIGRVESHVSSPGEAASLGDPPGGREPSH
jgi:hypothetical protein